MQNMLTVKEINQLAVGLKKLYTLDAIKKAIEELGYEVENESPDKLLAIHYHFGESKELLEILTGKAIPEGNANVVKATRSAAKKVLSYYIEAKSTSANVGNKSLTSGENVMVTKTKKKAPKSKAPKTKTKAKKAKGKGKGGFKKVGVVSEIRAMLERKQGASKKEIVAQLVKKFPDRGEEQMTSTVNTQLSAARLPAQTGGKLVKVDDAKRGRVYHLKGAKK